MPTRTAKIKALTPTTRANSSPKRHTFSTAMTSATPIIAARFITPKAMSTSISAQQHPTQYRPCSMPARRSRKRPVERRVVQQVGERGAAVAEAAELERGQLVDAEGCEGGDRRRRGRARDARRPAPRTPRPRRRRRPRQAPMPGGSRRPARRGGRCGDARIVRSYTATNGHTDGNIIAAIISAHMATNSPSPRPIVPGIADMSRLVAQPIVATQATTARTTRTTPDAGIRRRRGSGRAAPATSTIRPTRRTGWRTRSGPHRSS